MTILGRCESYGGNGLHERTTWCCGWQPVESPAERPSERDETVLAIIKESKLAHVKRLREDAEHAAKKSALVCMTPASVKEYADLLEKSL
jgi:hypothetical protein